MSDSKNTKPRNGFTTGSCAAAAAKAAAWMLLSGSEIYEVTIDTPKGIKYKAEIKDIKRTPESVSCAIVKDGGDDPDITTGTLIYAKVGFVKLPESNKPLTEEDKIDNRFWGNTGFDNQNEKKENDCRRILIEGGKGVGRVTKPGLDQPVGEAAINSVPRKMITKEVLEVLDDFDYDGVLRVEISVPDGEEIAKKTFNPKLGIEGGISIIGTSGIVEPMSTQAILDTIRLELNQRRVQGYETVIVSPGNYGLDFMRENYGYDLDKAVKCSNFIGLSVDMARELGFRKMLYVGHIGKLIKVAGGIMNTHSKEADCRMEILSAVAIEKGADVKTAREILNCVTTEDAVKKIPDEKMKNEIMREIVNRICLNLRKRAKDEIEVECIMFSKELGELAKSEGVSEELFL